MEIRLNHYTKVIGKRTILSDINLNFYSGEIVGLQGINGSGKTMLLRALCGLIYPTEGSLEMDGKVMGKDFSFPESVGALIESPAFLKEYTGKKNLEMIAALRGVASKEDIAFAMKRIGLEPDDKRTYKKYSLGMKQKLGIAAAIMEKPELIILDEPFNALDESSAKACQEIIMEEKNRGALVFLACHDKTVLSGLSDVLYSIEEGKITDCRRKEE